MEINRQIQQFFDMVALDAESYHERKTADAVKQSLKELGIDVYEDQAGEKLRELFGIEGEDLPAGNLYATFPGNAKGEPVVFCCHLDTVHPGIGKKPVLHEDGTITSDGTTVLGSDDLAGVSSILEAIRRIQENHLPHPDIELVFPVAEEQHGRGSALLDYSRIHAKTGYVLDLSGPVGAAATAAPTIFQFTVRIHGKAAHAGFAPETGINSVAIAANAITKIQQGWVDEQTTVNIGKIAGGAQSNIVCSEIFILGEIRSLDDNQVTKQWEQIQEIFADEAKKLGGTCSFERDRAMKAYRTEESDRSVKLFKEACRDLGLPGTLTTTLGGSDLNNMAQHGIHGIVASCGMQACHTVKEFVRVEDLENCTRLVVCLMTLACERAKAERKEMENE